MAFKHAMIPMLVASIVGCSSHDTTTDSNTTHSLTQQQQAMQSLNYPTTEKSAAVDTYFGTQVADPYRWLEDDRSSATASWVKQQNQVTQDYLNQIPFRAAIKARLTDLSNYEKVGAPFIEGKYTYFYKNDGLQNQYVLYQQGEQGEPRVFLDPNTFSQDGTTSLAGIAFSKDGSLAAYSISEGGSDWRKVKVIDTTSLQLVGETLVDVKFSGLAWVKNEGFFYSSYDKPNGSELSAKTDQHKLYFHRLNTPQSDDTHIFGHSLAQKHRYVQGKTTDDGRHVLISASTSTSGNKLFVLNTAELSSGALNLTTILDHTNSDTQLIHSDDQYFYFQTNLNAPNNRLVKAPIANPAPEHWQDIIPETDHVLSVSHGGGYLFAKYTVHALTQVKQYTHKGTLVRDITLPGLGTSSGFQGKDFQETLYYSFTNYNTPATIFSLDVTTGKSTEYRKSSIQFDSTPYVSEQVFYTSKDGTQVPMMITYKKGLKRDGKAPTLLYGYGGFNVSLLPRFSALQAYWLEQGGIYAVPNLRGGGEYGKRWHQAGTKQQKQNVFDDFIAAAEYLINEKYTSSQYLAVRGGSNGGLLVGAVMTQRPELFKVALPAVGVLDMLRYHKFTSGAGWAYDYGTADDNNAMFSYLLGYSPLHNVKNGVDYPATLITTGDHDDRVVPAHSFKFAAELQAKGGKQSPLLIRIETDAGHGAGTPLSKTIDQYADMYGFTLFNMGIKTL